MPYVKFTTHLKRFFPNLAPGEFEGETVAEIVAALDRHYPGLAAYVIDK